MAENAMPRKRTIDPDFFTDGKVTEVSLQARLLYLGTLVHADDEGRIEWDASQLRSRILASAVTKEQVEFYMDELVVYELIKSYEFGGKTYAYHPAWHRYQYTNKPNESKLPDPPGVAKRFVRDGRVVIDMDRARRDAGISRAPSGAIAPTVSAPVVTPEWVVPGCDLVSPIFTGELEVLASAVVAHETSQNVTGKISPTRVATMRRDISHMVATYGLDATLHGLRVALAKPAGIAYAKAVANDYEPPGARKAPLRAVPVGPKFGTVKPEDRDGGWLKREQEAKKSAASA